MSAAAPSPDLPTLQRDHAVAWMNRGHERQLRGEPAGALTAYDEAVALLQTLPLAGHPGWANSLGAALMNRGLLLHRTAGTTRAGEALASFDRAIGLLRPLTADPSPWPRRNLAGSLLNRAGLLLDLHRPADAQADARAALQLAALHEHLDLADADLGLKSRRALCDAIGQLITTPAADQNALAHEASDLVDDALALVRHWTGRGAPPPPELTVRLFRYGAQLYRLHQPHFLAEFILEHLGTTPADPEITEMLNAIARENIELALAETPDQPYLTVGDPATERRMQTWRDLIHVRTLLISPAPAGALAS